MTQAFEALPEANESNLSPYLVCNAAFELAKSYVSTINGQEISDYRYLVKSRENERIRLITALPTIEIEIERPSLENKPYDHRGIAFWITPIDTDTRNKVHPPALVIMEHDQTNMFYHGHGGDDFAIIDERENRAVTALIADGKPKLIRPRNLEYMP